MSSISIIMPVYNREKFLDRSVGSLISQTFKDIEIILVDDGSVDNSGKILDNFAKQDSRVKVFHQKNSGPATARNVGLDNATGEYIMFCDSDDAYEPNMCEVMYKTICEKRADLILCSAKNEYGTELYKFKKNLSIVDVFSDVVLWNKIFKKSLIDKYNIRFPDGYLSDDDYFTFVYACVSKKYYFTNKVSYFYVTENPDGICSMSLKKPSNLAVESHFYVIEAIIDFCKKNNFYKKYRKYIYDKIKETVFYLSLINYDYEKCLNLLLKFLEKTDFSTKEKDKVVKIYSTYRPRLHYEYPVKLDNSAKNIVFCVDYCYLNYLFTTIRSLCKNANKQYKYDVYIVYTNGLSYPYFEKFWHEFEKYKNITLHFCNISDLYNKYCDEKSFYQVGRIPAVGSYRLFLSKIFDGEKILYLDSGDIIVNKDVAEFFNLELKNNIIAAVKDFVFPRIDFKNTVLDKDMLSPFLQKVGYNDYGNYINSGVLLINLKEYNKCFDGFLKCMYEKSSNMDQDILNYVIPKSRILFLSTAYNFQIGSIDLVEKFDKEYAEFYKKSNLKNSFIIHYTRDKKPWKFYLKWNNIYFWKYAWVYFFRYIWVYKDLKLSGDAILSFVYNTGSENANVEVVKEPRFSSIRETMFGEVKHNNGICVWEPSLFVKMKVRAKGNGKIHIVLSGTDKKYIYYNKLIVNEKVLLNKILPVNQYNTTEFLMPVKDGEVIDLYIQKSSLRFIGFLKRIVLCIKRLFASKNKNFSLNIFALNTQSFENKVDVLDENRTNVLWLDYPKWLSNEWENGAFIATKSRYCSFDVRFIKDGMFKLILSTSKEDKIAYVSKVVMNDNVILNGIFPVSYFKRVNLMFPVNNGDIKRIKVYGKKHSIIGFIKNFFIKENYKE
ncbi:MAG: glycosyltransferase [Alphaproteobacteria bacterium]|nr:glycosyltransferase [Alphaproteobacteria bacterium]